MFREKKMNFKQADLVNEKLVIDNREYHLVNKIGEGKSATSFLYQGGGDKVTLKKYRVTEQNEIPFEQAMEFELVSYERLVESGVATPKLLALGHDDYFMVKEYIDGPVMIDLVAENSITDEMFKKMFIMNNRLKRHGYHVDYYPANFVMKNERMYCIDYETHIYIEEWDFPNWGIFYWLNNEGIRKILETGEHHHINKPGCYKPIDEPFMEHRNELVKLYGHLQV
jgi:TP53 regulating kinase-like protein